MYPNLDLLLLLLLHWAAVMAILTVGIVLLVILLLVASFLTLIAILLTDIYELFSYYPSLMYHLRNVLEKVLVTIVFYLVEMCQNMGSSRHVPAQVRPLMDAVHREDSSSVTKHDEPGNLAQKMDEDAAKSADVQSPESARHGEKGAESRPKKRSTGASVLDLGTEGSNKELQPPDPKIDVNGNSDLGPLAKEILRKRSALNSGGSR